MVLCTHARLGAESPLQLLANLVYDGKHNLLELVVSYSQCGIGGGRCPWRRHRGVRKGDGCSAIGGTCGVQALEIVNRRSHVGLRRHATGDVRGAQVSSSSP